MSRSRSYCFTSFLDHAHYQARGCEGDGVVYICWGEEVSPTTGRKHLQGFVQFAESVSLKTAKRRLEDDGLHLEQRRGSVKSAIEYCEKDGVFHEFGERPKQGKRSDIESVRELIAEGKGMRAIIDSGVSYQGLRYGEKVLTYTEPPRDWVTEVLWYWGKTGTGKSRAASAEATERYGVDQTWWSAGGLKWFDGYDGHQAMIIDDFRSEMAKLPFMLRLLDRHGMRIEFKGGYRQLRAKTIWITCPRPPQDCYEDAGEDIDQLLRRVTTIKEFV